MSFRENRTYAGFGFGPIQIGLFLFEAFHSGKFSRMIVSEINQDLVSAVKKSSGTVWVNIAEKDGLRSERIEGIEIMNPADPSDREKFIQAISEASDIGTALPSVNYYQNEHPGSPHRLLAEGLIAKQRLGKPGCVVYASENNNQAAKLLRLAVLNEMPSTSTGKRSPVDFVDTVIGKMSQTIVSGNQAGFDRLNPLTPDYPMAVLVEAYNKILISRIGLEAPYVSGFSNFTEMADLRPFEEAKLYGHNAMHAVLGGLGSILDIQYVSDLSKHPEVMGFVRSAFISEVGRALRKKHSNAGLMFSKHGFEQYADDLLTRMVNPYLKDHINRIIRDLPRKLGWNDRFIGGMRLCQSQGIAPKRLAFGAACALYVHCLKTSTNIEENFVSFENTWRGESDSLSDIEPISKIFREALETFLDWKGRGFSLSFLSQLSNPAVL